MKKLSMIIAVGLLALAAGAANLALNYQSITIANIPRGSTGTAVLSIFNASGATVTNTISIAQDAIYDASGNLLTWLTKNATTVIQTNGQAASSVTFTASTASWTVTNQMATAVITVANANGSYAIPLVASASNLYAPTLTNRFLNVDGTTNVVIVIPTSQGGKQVYSWGINQ